MTRRFLRIALVAALTLSGAAPATAAEQYTDTPAPAEWQRLLAPAATAWPGQAPNCPQGIRVLIMHGAAEHAAMAEMPGCRIWINDITLHKNPSTRLKCLLLAHEYGHLLGHRHQPGTLMDETTVAYNAHVPACEQLTGDRLTVPSAAQRAGALAGAGFLVRGCRRLNPREITCVTTRLTDRRQRRVTVSQSADGTVYSTVETLRTSQRKRPARRAAHRGGRRIRR